MKKWLFGGIVVVAIILGLVGWRLVQKHAADAAQLKTRLARTSAPVSVEYGAAKYHDIIHTFEAIGSVEPIVNVNVTPKVTAVIQDISVREGDHVKRGEVLVRIDPTA